MSVWLATEQKLVKIPCVGILMDNFDREFLVHKAYSGTKSRWENLKEICRSSSSLGTSYR